MDDIVIYTAIFDKKDALLQAPNYEGCKNICFTEDENLINDSKGWEICIQKPDYENPRLNARIFKILPHGFLRNYKRSVWIDGNIQLLKNPRETFEELTTSIGLYKHGYADNVDQEAVLCNQRGFNKNNIITNQIAQYRREGFQEANPHPMNGIIYRVHNDPHVAQTMETWWNEVKNKSIRDQISFSYSCWKNGLDFSIIGEQSYSIQPHNYE